MVTRQRLVHDFVRFFAVSDHRRLRRTEMAVVFGMRDEAIILVDAKLIGGVVIFLGVRGGDVHVIVLGVRGADVHKLSRHGGVGRLDAAHRPKGSSANAVRRSMRIP